MTRPHFVGTDASEAPVVDELLNTARKLADAGATEGVVSARYGPRTVVNAAGVPLPQLAPSHFVEVADYDPLTDQSLCLGPRAPHADASLHALVYRAKKEVNAMAQVDAPAERVPADAPRVERKGRALDVAMRTLEALRGSDVVVIGDRSVLVTGDTVKRVRERALGLVREA